jgi:precorrin isomerase
MKLFDSKICEDWVKLTKGIAFVSPPSMVRAAIKREREREINELKMNITHPGIEDITTMNGITWRFYHKCGLIDGLPDGFIAFQLANLIHGNVLLVRNKDGLLIYVPKSHEK